MKFLHTSDWHVGKTLKGRNRLDEQRAVLGEIVRIARKEAFDAILIAGDLYETSAPSAAAQELVVQALMALRETGAEVLAIAGNHDHAATFEAYRPLLRAAGIQLSGDPRPVADGGVVSFDARSTGERVNVAVLPFLSQRYAVRAAELLMRHPGGQRRPVRPARARHPGAPQVRLHRRRRQPRHGAPDRDRRRDGRRGTRGAVHLRVPRRRRRRSAPTRTTSRSGTCTGASRCPRPARCTTAARRCPSISANRTTRASCCRWR